MSPHGFGKKPIEIHKEDDTYGGDSFYEGNLPTEFDKEVEFIGRW